ncbi:MULTISPECIES: hypothetical protein [Serratia]|uniref:hypothetical protein n=1 Tax=Serratia TaxID=613 RepID=UPI000660366F|nr:hypothetical protein [Serratia sp. 506_PEND]
MINMIISGQTLVGKTTAINVIHPDKSRLVEIEDGLELLNAINTGHIGGISSISSMNAEKDYQRVMALLALKYKGGE